MFWADDIADRIQERFEKKIREKTPLVIRDEKTLSGRVHVGSLRGIVIHGVIGQVLTERKIGNQFLFELNDNDPMDGLPVYVDEKKFRPHMGKPLFAVPPVSDSEENFATGFGNELKETVAPMGFPIEWYHLRPLYVAGKFNDCIKTALEHPTEIRAIYREVSGSEKPADWLPLNVICPTCGKIGTTQVTGWDPKKKTVTFVCKKDLVAWAEGCGMRGEVDPFDGRATLPWKVEWAAKWKVMGVDIEGAGKDHNASGGSREVSARISEEVFKYPEPFNIPYEFFNFQGKKMSASKGLGSSAKEIADLLPPHILKFLMIRKEPLIPIDFDPEGNTIPVLFDEYDRCGDHYFHRHSEPFEGYARAFALSQTDTTKEPENLWEMRFQSMCFAVQMPHIDLEEEAEKLKGAKLIKEETRRLRERSEYVRGWVNAFAPAAAKYSILDRPPRDLTLDAEQKKAFTELEEKLSTLKEWTGEEIHAAVHAVKASVGIAPKKLFPPLYQLFLGRDNGPQVGWFLSTFPKASVIGRLREVAG